MALQIWLSFKIKRIVLGICLIAMFTGFALSLKKYGGALALTAKSNLPPRSTIQSHQSQNKKFPMILVNLTRFGFEPSAVEMEAGRCRVTVRDLIGSDSLELEVTRKNGDKLVKEKKQQSSGYWEKMIDMTPGEYQISTPANPQWVLNVSVLPPGQAN